MVQYLCVQPLLSVCCAKDKSRDFGSIAISESTRTALECVLRCDHSGKKTDKI